jgi:hypothetical protein
MGTLLYGVIGRSLGRGGGWRLHETQATGTLVMGKSGLKVGPQTYVSRVVFCDGNAQLLRRGNFMFCPMCRTEFQEGFSRCSECEVDLVDERPLEPEPEYVQTVTVFQGDSNSAAVAHTMLEGAGIEAWTKDENVHGVYPNLGATEVEVRVEDEAAALEALETMCEGAAGEEECAPGE